MKAYHAPIAELLSVEQTDLLTTSAAEFTASNIDDLINKL